MTQTTSILSTPEIHQEIDRLCDLIESRAKALGRDVKTVMIVVREKSGNSVAVRGHECQGCYRAIARTVEKIADANAAREADAGRGRVH